MIERVAEIFELSPDSELLLQALTHPSYANENRPVEDNQRLEFLGDAVLGLCISDYLFREKPGSDEGLLTQIRSQLVNAEWLSTWGRSVNLHEAIRLGRGAVASSAPISNNVIADAVEACIAATFLTSGLETARRVCVRIMQPALDQALFAAQPDPKSELQQVVQALGVGLPHYEVLATRGPAHERSFEVRVGAAGQWLATGVGRSKRAAERAAAACLLAQREELLMPLVNQLQTHKHDSEPDL